VKVICCGVSVGFCITEIVGDWFSWHCLKSAVIGIVSLFLVAPVAATREAACFNAHLLLCSINGFSRAGEVVRSSRSFSVNPSFPE
jgi:hypothetical protein